MSALEERCRETLEQSWTVGDREGARVTRKLIEAYVSRPPAPTNTNHHGLEELTTREREVLSLIARGLTNAEIAQPSN